VAYYFFVSETEGLVNKSFYFIKCVFVGSNCMASNDLGTTE